MNATLLIWDLEYKVLGKFYLEIICMFVLLLPQDETRPLYVNNFLILKICSIQPHIKKKSTGRRGNLVVNQINDGIPVSFNFFFCQSHFDILFLYNIKQSEHVQNRRSIIIIVKIQFLLSLFAQNNMIRLDI